ncbi:MAG: CinA family protein [Spirochaetaceae bacterium]|jgi:PncC family amidohydrolase|nr:CinA family protein [Spirochaetaceae bacterium]
MDNIARGVVERLKAAGLRVVFAESCTAGLISDTVCRISGVSAVLWGSFICYSLEAKEAMLGIPNELLKNHGAVSGETAAAMASGALKKSGVDLAVAVTGLAGPEGDGGKARIGDVWIGVCVRNGRPHTLFRKFAGSRAQIRKAAAKAALEVLNDAIRATLIN